MITDVIKDGQREKDRDRRTERSGVRTDVVKEGKRETDRDRRTERSGVKPDVTSRTDKK